MHALNPSLFDIALHTGYFHQCSGYMFGNQADPLAQSRSNTSARTHGSPALCSLMPPLFWTLDSVTGLIHRVLADV